MIIRNRKLIAVIVAVAIILTAVIIVSASPDETADVSPNMGLSLGLSGLMIERPEDLKELADRVNTGEDVSGSYFTLAINIDMSMFEEWTPIGTKENPFKGYFDGNNHIISGMGTEEYSSLFGYIEDSTLRNIQINSAVKYSLSDTQGLFIKAKNSTIENCNVYFAAQAVMFFNAPRILPQTGWFDRLVSTTYTINSVGEFLGIAKIIQDGTDDFDGITINLGNLDLGGIGEDWDGIGTESMPFKGDVYGGSLSNLTMRRPGVDYVAPFAHVKDATFDGVKILDANILGANSVGALIGKMEETKVLNCMSSGDVMGTHKVGGLIGEITSDPLFSAPKTTTQVKWCYSTVDVIGTIAVGGLIGYGKARGESHFKVPGYNNINLASDDTKPIDSEIRYCFTTGNVVGAVITGGLVGMLEITDLQSMAEDEKTMSIADSATSGDVRGSGSTGGILGSGNPGGADEHTQMYNCYTAGTVYAYADSGILAGLEASSIFTYTSGHIVAPEAGLGLQGESITRATGYNDGSFVDYDAMVVEANTIYSSSNYLNEDDSVTSYLDGFKRAASSCEYGYLQHEPIFLDENPFYQIGGGAHPNGSSNSNFSAANLTYNVPSTPPSQQRDIYAVSGTYPQLDAFVSPTGPNASAFTTFNALTTEVANRGIPRFIYVNGTSAVDSGGNEIKLPNIPGLVWSINAGNSGAAYSVEDPTLDSSGENKIEIVTEGGIDKLKATGKFVESEEIVISAKVPAIDGFELKYTTTFKDETVRPILDTIPEAFYDDVNVIKDENVKVYHSKSSDVIVIGFTEPLKFVTGISGDITKGEITIEEYPDNKFSAPSTSHTDKVVGEIINNTILRLTFESGFLEYNKGYMLDFSDILSDTLVDEAGIKWTQEYYFKTAVNEAPVLSFEDNAVVYPLAASPSVTDNASGKQTIHMVEDDVRFYSMYDGINATDTVPINGLDANAISLISPGNQNAGGQPGYPALDLVATSTNFYKIPGTYEIEYQIADPEDPASLSGIITRTFLVDGAVSLTQGGGNLKDMKESLTQVEVLKMMEDNPGMTLERIINKYLVDKYINTSGANKLEAYKYNYVGQREEKAITFNTGMITNDTITYGLQGVISFTVEDGDTHNFPISIEGLQPDKDIYVDSNKVNYVVNKNRNVMNSTYSKGAARLYYNAKVVKMSEPLVALDDRLVYDFSAVDQYMYDVPQEVTIKFYDTSEFDALGIDAPTKKVLITIKQNYLWEHDEQKWFDKNQDRDGFWEGKLETIRNLDGDKLLPVELSFYYGLEAPRDFFLVLGNKDNNIVEFQLPNDYKLTFDSNNIVNSSVTKEPVVYNFNVEDMYSYHVERDVDGAPVHQFYTSGNHQIPGGVTLSIPVDENLPTKGLMLYTISKDTGMYELEEKIKSSSISDGVLTLELDSFKGEYIITTASLDGTQSSLEVD